MTAQDFMSKNFVKPDDLSECLNIMAEKKISCLAVMQDKALIGIINQRLGKTWYLMKILIMGLSGSGKTFLSKLLQKELSCAWYNADNLREMANDWDFSMKDAKDKVLE